MIVSFILYIALGTVLSFCKLSIAQLVCIYAVVIGIDIWSYVEARLKNEEK
jgi:hypothetical protein